MNPTIAKINLVRRIYTRTLDDATLVKFMMDVVDDILNPVYPDKKLGPYHTIGDMRGIRGFYTDEWFVNGILGLMIRGGIRQACDQISFEVTPDDIETLVQLFGAEEQQDRLVPIAIRRCILKYGQPMFVDEDKLETIKMRYDEDVDRVGDRRLIN